MCELPPENPPPIIKMGKPHPLKREFGKFLGGNNIF
jgi:hypothetical protein